MKAWLERVHPPGEPLELPDLPVAEAASPGKPLAALVLGRGHKATVVFDDPLIGSRHCELSYDGTFWRVRDLGTDNGTSVNGAPIRWPRALFRGDELQLGTTRLRFGAEAPVEEPRLVEAIARDPDDEAAWLVWADWLLDHGDPRGERIAQARGKGRLDHLGWLGPLGDAFISGGLEIDWHLGFVRRAVLRKVPAADELDWRFAVSTLLQLPLSRFARELTVDVPRFTRAPRARARADVVEALGYVAALPAIPSTLERLTLGCLVGERAPAVPVPEALAARAPRLRGTGVFASARTASLRLLSTVGQVRFDGLREGVRALTDIARLRRGTPTRVHLETPPGLTFIADGNPCFFRPEAAGWQLIAGRLRGEVRVNNRVDGVYELLPGDVIELTGAGRLRFEVEP